VTQMVFSTLYGTSTVHEPLDLSFLLFYVLRWFWWWWIKGVNI